MSLTACDPKPSFATGEVSETAFKGVTQSYLIFNHAATRACGNWSTVSSGDDQTWVTLVSGPPAARASGLELEGRPRTCRTGRRMSRRRNRASSATAATMSLQELEQWLQERAEIPAQRGPETGASSIRVTRLLFPLSLSPLQALLEFFFGNVTRPGVDPNDVHM